MMQTIPFTYRQAGSYLLVAILFVIVSYAIRGHEQYIGLLLAGGSGFGMAIFILLTTIFVIFVIPLDIVFLIPLGVSLWGPVPTALMSITGWTLGAGAAFALSRRWGLPLVTRIVGVRHAREFHDRIPKTNLFWSVVALRMLVPVDLLSYALGLFSRLSWKAYILATVIGVMPFGFYFAYAGTLPPWYQFAAVAVVLLAAPFILARYREFRQEPPVSDDDQNQTAQE